MTNGVIAGAILTSDLQNTVLPAWQVSFSSLAARDCSSTQPPNCGCTNGSEGKAAIGLFDTAPQNCVITLAELQNNALIQSLLAPDVTVEGLEAVSVGVGFEAVLGSFMAP